MGSECDVVGMGGWGEWSGWVVGMGGRGMAFKFIYLLICSFMSRYLLLFPIVFNEFLACFRFVFR